MHDCKITLVASAHLSTLDDAIKNHRNHRKQNTLPGKEGNKEICQNITSLESWEKTCQDLIRRNRRQDHRWDQGRRHRHLVSVAAGRRVSVVVVFGRRRLHSRSSTPLSAKNGIGKTNPVFRTLLWKIKT